MTPKEAINYAAGMLKNGGNKQKQDFVNIVTEALENQIPKCYGVVINPNKEPFIIEFKRNYATTLEFIDGVWVAHRKHKEGATK